MLESVWHQGTGLHWQGAAAPLHVLSVVPSGDAADAHAVWLACAHLQQQGYPVVVLDGTSKEGPDAPGLQDLLLPRTGMTPPSLPADIRDPLQVATLPAACGMVQVLHKAEVSGIRPLDIMYRCVRQHAVLVLWAPAPLLAPLLYGSHSAPLLLVPAQKRSVVATYRQLKLLFMTSGLMPRLVALRPADSGLDPVLKSLSQCAQHHLHTEPLCDQLDPWQTRQLQRWALQCLEHAECVQPASAAAAASPDRPSPSPAVWSH